MTFGQAARRVWKIMLWPFYLFPRLFVQVFTSSVGVARRPGPMDAPETHRKRAMQVVVVLGIIALSTLVVLFSKTRPAELGTARFITEHRPLPEFSQLFVSDDQWVEITIDPDAARMISTFMDDNLVQFVMAEVVDGTLRIETSKEMNQSLGSIIRIVANSLEGVTVNDGSIIEIVGVDTRVFFIDATDGSSVKVAGAAPTVDVRVDGSRVTTRLLAAEDVTVAVEGESIIDIFAAASIVGTAGGEAEIRISGSPPRISIVAADGALVCQSTLPLDVPFTCIR